jgi:uncharacterized protein (DUF433 family)
MVALQELSLRSGIASGTGYRLPLGGSRLTAMNVTFHSVSATTQNYDDRIVCTKGVCGGLPRIKGSRMPVWILLSHRSKGVSDKKLLQLFPYLKQDDLDAAWRFAQRSPQQATRRA